MLDLQWLERELTEVLSTAERPLRRLDQLVYLKLFGTMRERMIKTYSGSCHCGAIGFSCDLDLSEGTSKCNCTICTKTRFWKAIVKPDAFRLIQGRDDLADYRFGSGRIHHHFCRHCGVKTFGHANIEGLGEFYAINLACLDDATAEELAAAPVKYEDGRHDRWEAAPVETKYL